MFVRRAGLAIMALVASLFVAAAAQAQSDIGVVLMHGKQGMPGRPPGLADLAGKLRAAGIKVVTPEMPWSSGRWEHIDVTVEQVFDQIDGYVAQLKAQGARRIVVGGHSLGANIALGYAVTRGNVAGVVMLSPGHAPGFFYSKSAEFRSALEKARALVEAGQGSQALSGPDDNQGRIFTVSTTAQIYQSWMSPMGLASMPRQAPNLPSTIPVLVTMGKDERALANTQSQIYQPAAKHSYSRFIAESGDHQSAVDGAASDALAWIKGLPQ
jgi:pimeloyl-ACP methyl ester carboxylesterase